MLHIKKMFRSRAQIAFLAACAAILTVAFLFFFGIYPIAVVNGSIITARQFHIDTAASSFYYENMLRNYTQGQKNAETIDSLEIESEMLNGLIENKLVSEELNKNFGKELPYLLSEKLSGANDSQDLREAAKTLYGMDWGDFKREILIPQAMRDILSEHLFLKKEKAEDWLVRAKTSARIMLFSLKFGWDGSKVFVN